MRYQVKTKSTNETISSHQTFVSAATVAAKVEGTYILDTQPDQPMVWGV